MEAEVKTGRVARPTPPSIRNVAPVALTVACAGAFSFLSGGYIFTRSAPLAIAYLLLAALWVWFLRRGSRPSPLYLCALGTFGLFVAWVGLSVLWSLGPDLSWMAFDLAALYLVVAAVLGLTPVRRLQLLVAAAGFLVVAVAVAVYAYLGKVLPDVVTHAHTYARLDSPIGYWNVLALMMIMALMVVLALAGDRRVRAVWRMLAAVAGVPLCFTFFFTLSRGGWIALAVALVVYFALCTTRLASLATLVAVAAPVAAALWRVRDLGTLFQATTDDILRTQQGHILLRYSIAALVIAGGAQAVVLLLQGGVPWPRWSRVAAGVAILVLLVGGVGGGSFAFVQARGGVSWVKARVHAFASDSDTTQPAEGTVRLVSVNTGRPPLWREALDQARLDPVTGSGAGTFAFTNYRFRKTGGVVKHAHSEWFNVLSELGIVPGHGPGLVEKPNPLAERAEVDRAFSRRTQGDPGLGGQGVGLGTLGRIRLGGEVMAGEGSGELVRAECFEEPGSREVATLAVLPGKRVVGDLADEGLDEGVLTPLGGARVHLEREEFPPDEGAQARLKLRLANPGNG